jgi:hypothetical protein
LNILLQKTSLSNSRVSKDDNFKEVLLFGSHCVDVK